MKTLKPWPILFFLTGAGLGVALALGAGAILSRIDDNLLWLIPIAGVLGLLALFAFDMLQPRG
jgi:hypothetical protein